MLKAIALSALIAVVPIQTTPKAKRPPAPAPQAQAEAPTNNMVIPLDMTCMDIEFAIKKINEDGLQLLFAAKVKFGLITVYANPRTRNWVEIVVPTHFPSKACILAAGEGYRFEFPGFPA